MLDESSYWVKSKFKKIDPIKKSYLSLVKLGPNRSLYVSIQIFRMDNYSDQ